MSLAIETPHRRVISAEAAFGVLAMMFSVALVIGGIFAVEYPRPGAATGDPFLFFLRP
jgi:hypothetical protein